MVPNDEAPGGRTTARPLPRPADIRRRLPLTPRRLGTVRRARQDVSAILSGHDDRLLVVVGPCSIHDPAAGLEYAHRLADRAAALADELCIVMRAYVEKPRTVAGWKGLINDPGLDGSFRVEDGIVTARTLLMEILDLDLPVGCEFVDPLLAPFLADAISWGVIGARTVQSPVHRQLASGLAMPVGFKNSTGGDIQVAIDAAVAASAGQVALGITDNGQAAVVETAGNPHGHVVLRGGAAGPNSGWVDIADTRDRLVSSGLPDRVVVDASHGNSGKDHRAQATVATDVAALVGEGRPGIAGVMLESFLVPGRQSIAGDRSTLTYGQSVTDACLGWEETAATLEVLAGAVAARRGSAPPPSGLVRQPVGA